MITSGKYGTKIKYKKSLVPHQNTIKCIKSIECKHRFEMMKCRMFVMVTVLFVVVWLEVIGVLCGGAKQGDSTMSYFSFFFHFK